MTNDVVLMGHRFRKHVLVEITKGCNLACLHCFTNAGRKLEKELATEEWISLLDDLVKHGFEAFTISGGEPLTQLDKSVSLISSIKKTYPKVKFYLFTNGLLLTDEIISSLRTYISGVGISLDGNRETHDYLRHKSGSYDEAVKAIQLLTEKNIPTFIQCMVTPQTMPFLSEVVLLAQEFSVKAIRLAHVDFFGRGKLNKSDISIDQSGLELLSKKIIALRKQFPEIFITSNLVKQNDIRKYPGEFIVPNLHILSNGNILPWEGLPVDYALWKYPEFSLENLLLNNFEQQLGKFEGLVKKALLRSINSTSDILAFDNIISEVLD